VHQLITFTKYKYNLDLCRSRSITFYKRRVWHANAVLCIKINKLCCVHLNRVAKTVHRDGNLAYRDVCSIDRVATITYRDVNFICRDVSCIFRDANFIRRDVSK